MAIVVSYNQSKTVSGKSTMIAPMERVSVMFSDANASQAMAYFNNIAQFRQPLLEVVSREVEPARVLNSVEVKPKWYRAKEVLFWKIKKTKSEK